MENKGVVTLVREETNKNIKERKRTDRARSGKMLVRMTQ